MGKLVELAISEDEKDKHDLSIPIKTLIEKWGINWVCKNRVLDQNFIEEWIEEINIHVLLEHQSLSKKNLFKFRDLIHHSLSSSLKNHIFLEISGNELRSYIKKIIRHIRESSFEEGRTKYKIFFSGFIGEELYNKHIKNYRFNIRTSSTHKQIEIETGITKTFNNNCIRIYLNNNVNSNYKIYII